MKKLLFVALIGTFVACGEATDTTTDSATDTSVGEDTAVLVPNNTDTTVVIDTTGADTTAPAAQ